jgi:phenylalanyl-tRNA synthetase beta chain
MRVPLEWLREFVPWEGGAEELGERLALAGLELDGVDRPADAFNGIIVGEVLEAAQHPNADRLTLCRVTTGGEPVSIVCGAPNVAAGQRVPVATVGSVLPGGMKIKKAKIRGEVSHGMICSEIELELGDDADGIIVLDSDAPVGKPFAEYQGLSGEVLELDVPPNRPDALCIYGIAREVAALYNLPLSPWQASVVETGAPASDTIAVEVEDEEGCPRYSARLIRGVQPGPSPAWMAGRLRAAGLRPINVIVDITNYIMWEIGQPQHAFDLKRVAEGRIIVRRAQAGEALRTLDGQLRQLDPEMLLITDPDGPIALAGVMGGEDSEISDETTEILLESAHFDPIRVAIAGGRTALLSESRRRFERGTDPTIPGVAADRAAALMAELAGGEVAPGLVEAASPAIRERQTVLVRGARVDRLLGVEVPEPDVRDILGRLGFELAADGSGNAWAVTVPPWRPDVTGEAYVAEEIARLYGYDELGSDIRLSGIAPVGPTARQRLREKTSDALVYLGITEVVTSSLVPRESRGLITPDYQAVELANPISADLAELRTDLLPGILQVVRHNLNRQQRDVRIFELGPVYRVEEGATHQEDWLVGAITGGRAAEPWSVGSDEFDWHDLWGLLSAVASALNLDTLRAQPYDGPTLESGLGAVITTGEDREIGRAGLLDRGLAGDFDLEPSIWVFAFQLDSLEAVRKEEGRFTGLPRYPASDRDISVTLPESVALGPLLVRIEQAGQVESVQLVDEYRGEQIPEGWKGITLSVRYRHPDKTLSENEIEVLHKGVVEIMRRDYDAQLRT